MVWNRVQLVLGAHLAVGAVDGGVLRVTPICSLMYCSISFSCWVLALTSPVPLVIRSAIERRSRGRVGSRTAFGSRDGLRLPLLRAPPVRLLARSVEQRVRADPGVGAHLLAQALLVAQLAQAQAALAARRLRRVIRLLDGRALPDLALRPRAS